MPGRFATLHVPHYPRGWKLAGEALATGMWLWVLYMCKERGPYVFVSGSARTTGRTAVKGASQGLRDKFEDHSTPAEYIKYHENVWKQPPADYSPEAHTAPDGDAVRVRV
jgi:hypothetical protein